MRSPLSVAPLLLLLALPGPREAKATSAGAGPTAAAPLPSGDGYQLVLLQRGPAWTAEESPAVEALRQQHLAHVRRMGQLGKLVASGPFENQPDPSLRGMCLYRTETAAEARALAEQDPAVRAGRLRVQVLAWRPDAGPATLTAAR